MWLFQQAVMSLPSRLNIPVSYRNNLWAINWVMTAKADGQAVATDGMSAGLDNNYIKPNDERVIGATEIIGGGEETSTTFSVKGLSKDEDYMFFCSFPGHIGIMQGTVTLES